MLVAKNVFPNNLGTSFTLALSRFLSLILYVHAYVYLYVSARAQSTGSFSASSLYSELSRV